MKWLYSERLLGIIYVKIRSYDFFLCVNKGIAYSAHRIRPPAYQSEKRKEMSTFNEQMQSKHKAYVSVGLN